MRYRVKPETVNGWIRTGQLRAINVARQGCTRPRYRIDPTDLAAFEQRRTVVTEPAPKRRRQRHDNGIIEFF
jgi:hypothetical protein